MDIIVSDLTKNFGKNLVLDQFSATFPVQTLTCIMGPSGCGKTTLLNILMGLLPADRGTISGMPSLKSAVFQEDRLCESFSALSNIRLVCDKKVGDAQILAHLEAIGLKDSPETPVSTFSGGMKRRVAIVRATLAKSDILFLDEPFKGLDDETKSATMQYVKNNIKGRTVIMVTHNIEEVKTFGGRLVTLGDGRLCHSISNAPV